MNENDPNNQNENLQELDNPALTVNEEQQEISKSLDGFWMNDGYLSEIERTKSVYQSKDYEIGWFGVYFDLENLIGNEPKIMGISSHEGGIDCKLEFNESLKQYESSDLCYTFKEPFLLTMINSNKIQVEAKDKSRKLLYRKSIDDQTSIREILFKGEFTFLEDPGQTALFKSNGDVFGFGNNVYYEVVYDFGEGINYDVILISQDEKSNLYTEGTAFNYKFSNDSLFLNLVNTNWDTMDHEITDSTIVLIKNR